MLDCPYHPRWPDIPHPEQIRLNHKRKTSSKNKVSKGYKKRLKLYEQDKRCRYCLEEMDFEEATLDHIIPRDQGGSNIASNLTLACYSCNQKKKNNIWIPKF